MADLPGDGATEPVVVLPEELWRARERDHLAAVDALVGDHRRRRAEGRRHPVVDFLFTYYPTRVGALRRWHPGTGVLLAGGTDGDRVRWRHYRPATVRGHEGVLVDPRSVRERAGARMDRARRIITSTRSRPAMTGCFGLHEWAMLYDGSGPDAGDPTVRPRHQDVPLRLPRERIDQVVREADLRCTHFDAFRFFTPGAVPLNRLTPTRADQHRHEQPGCLHAGMDLYHWACLMEAACPGELLVATLRAAFDAREVDMRSSPYDLREWGLEPIAVETPEGRARFAAHQRGWAGRTEALRGRLLAALDRTDRLASAADPVG